MAGGKGLEPLTSRVRIWRSANWTNPQYRERNKARFLVAQFNRLFQIIAVWALTWMHWRNCGWGGWIWTIGCRSQSPVPYRLATPQYKQGTFSCCLTIKLSALAGGVGLEPTIHKLCNCCMCLYLFTNARKSMNALTEPYKFQKWVASVYPQNRNTNHHHCDISRT